MVAGTLSLPTVRLVISMLLGLRNRLDSKDTVYVWCCPKLVGQSITIHSTPDQRGGIDADADIDDGGVEMREKSEGACG